MVKRKYSKLEKRNLVLGYQESGKSITSWCKENGISMSTFHAWLYKQKDKIFSNTSTELDFIEIKPNSLANEANKDQNAALNNKFKEDSDCTSSKNIILEIYNCKLTISPEVDCNALENILRVVTKLNV